MSDTPSALATRRMAAEYKRLTGSMNIPSDLVYAVVRTVNTVGYTKKLVDDMVRKFLEANPR